ncbi:MAG: hypothetical protein A3F84_03040 [Candidatus Handelsmanbacteria bacterium RIFCSPLOWO2_12_FULL_64_10]|uniref:Uncharacterized protein n=1 Tax=Handelsmanbacteria sp. (strain RIFCSPLOWO2_12_FULL_64_10) TaxID=1817868 RepID=A0A1F6C7G2_HANXR|nr:MAG: hypothetical protein A3F84_03040 [Candidatus Handelsmanbacteria bacterium RIFCSPLOWO2_12_FULL_64_10]
MRYVIILIAFIALFASRARAESAEIDRLEAERGRLGRARDSLLVQRGRLAAEVDRLSARIDSLRAPGGGEFREALRRSPRLVGRLEGLDRDLERAGADLEGVRERLRAAYDREIEALVRRLAQGPDEALVRQLVVYEKAREALGRGVVSEGAGPGAEALSIREEDGPEEVRQKADLLEDMAGRLRAEAAEVARQVRQLETERRLRARVAAFAREVSLFDEHLPEGRTVSPSEAKVGASPPSGTQGAVPPGVAQAPGFEGSKEQVRAGDEAASQGALVAGKEVAREEGSSLEEPSVEDLVAEIQRLKARQREAQERERALRERAGVFRERLRRMLEGRE